MTTTHTGERVGGPDGIAVLVVEDDAIVRRWVQLAMEGTEFRVAGEAVTAGDAAALAARRRVDLLLVDQHLPDDKGTNVLRELRKVGLRSPAVLMTASAQRGLNEAARDAGFQASVIKSSDPDQFVAVLRDVVAGVGVFDAGHPRRPDSEAALSPRERETIVLVAHGKTNKEIAAALGISDETVKTLLERAYTKLGVHRRAEAVYEARRRGIV